jgi:hypothetical protein
VRANRRKMDVVGGNSGGKVALEKAVIVAK